MAHPDSQRHCTNAAARGSKPDVCGRLTPPVSHTDEWVGAPPQILPAIGHLVLAPARRSGEGRGGKDLGAAAATSVALGIPSLISLNVSFAARLIFSR